MTQSTLLCENCSASNRATAKFCKVCGSLLQISPTLLKQRYQILTVVGQGGFGAIYKAEDTHFPNHPKRAVKEMLMQSRNPHEQQQAIEAFKQEGLLLAGLMHPNLPRIYDYFEEGGRWYLVMDYINGETLEHRVQTSSEHKLPFHQVLHFANQLCTVLDYLHSQQPPIIFRDLKPANVMVASNDHLYLIDFGIARLFKPGQAKDTSAFGSPGYAAPEQYGKTQTTERADIYSLGATLHYLLSGEDPSEHPFHFSVLDLAHDAPPGPKFAKLIEQMVAMDAQKRPPSVQVIRKNLQLLALQPVQKTHPGQPRTANKNSSVKNEHLWDACEEMWKRHELVTGKIVKVKKHGLVVDVDGLYGFVPRSHISQTVTEQDLQDRIGSTLQLRILQIDRTQSRFTLSERLATSGSPAANHPPSKKKTTSPQSVPPTPPPSQPTIHDYINQSKALIDSGKYREALEVCEQALRLDLSSALIYINKAAALDKLGRYQQALAVSDQALRYDPQNALAYVNRAAALNGLGRYREALDTSNQALRYDSRSALAHYNASEALCELGDYRQALVACEQALRLDPCYSSAYINKSRALIELGRYQEALNACEQALRYDPHAAMAHNNAGVALMSLGKYQQALDAYEKALQLNPDHTKARANREALRKKLWGY